MVAGAIVAVARLDAAPTGVDVEVVGAGVAGTVVVGFPGLLLPLDEVDDDGVAACTIDGFKGDGVCIVSYGTTVGIAHGAGADV